MEKPDLVALINDQRYPFSFEEALAFRRAIVESPELPATYWDAVIEALEARQTRWSLLGLREAA